MASIGHVVVGVAAARIYRAGQPTTWAPFSAAVVWSGLSLLPDADVIGFRFGVPYADAWGHRGATHSLMFALSVGLLAWLLAKAAKLPPRRTALLAAAVVTSHPLLDTLTDGGLGCALLWPFSTERFFAPWTPLPVAPMGRAFLSREGLHCATVELLALFPLLLYAFWPLRARQRHPDPAAREAVAVSKPEGQGLGPQREPRAPRRSSAPNRTPR